MDGTCGRPQLNNFELVNRALRTVMVPLQDCVISEMKYQFGQSWWVEGVIPKRYALGIPDYAPSKGDVPDDTARSYMDVTLCLNLISTYKLLPEGLHREARDPLNYFRDLRNNLSHFGKPDYTMLQAQDAIRLICMLDGIMELGCKEALDSLYMATMAPLGDGPSQGSVMTSTTPPSQPAPSEPSAESVRSNGVQSGSPATTHFPRPVGQKCSQIDACVMASRGMYEKLKEKQMEAWDTSRFTSRVLKIVPRDDHYILTIDKSMMIDDSLGVIANGHEFTGMQVSFDRYNSASRTIHMYPGPELRELIDSGATDIQVFSDMKWLVSRTTDFMTAFGNQMRFPPIPLSYTPSILLSGMRMSDEQKDAVAMAMSEPLSYVWGVPGSGKTQSVLAASIGECVRRGERVAVIAPTNLALEQVLRGLLRAFREIPQFHDIIDPSRDIVRIGTPTSEFATEFPDICEGSGVRRQLMDKIQMFNHVNTTMLERRYEKYRPLCDECVETAAKLEPEDVSGRKALLKRMEPIIDTMLEDERFMLNARRINQGNIAEDVPRVRKLIYDRDRSDYLENDLKGRSDDSLDAWLTEMAGQIASLRPKDRSSNLDNFKVVAMTLSKFIISYGPDGDERRRSLDVDHVFVDEAGYCNCLQTLSLFTLGAPITLLGDHMQLPPVCELNHDELEESIIEGGEHRFDYLWDLSALYVDHFFDDDLNMLRDMYLESKEPDFVRMAHRELKTTFRFGPNLAEALGRYVYPSGMVSASQNPLDVQIIRASIDEFPQFNGKVVRRNEEEAEAVSAIVDSMGLRETDYVILTPYNDQIRCLKRYDPTLSDHVLTIHKSQGREWDTVIVSVVDGHQNPEDKPPRFTSTQVIEGARVGLKVINTALSRAKKRLIIVCDRDHWAAQQEELLGEIVRNSP